MQAVILAGGKGTRLKDYSGNLPKPMVEVGGHPILEHQVLLAREYGITDVLMLTASGATYIEDYFGNGERWGLRITYHRETELLGTAGAVLGALEKVEKFFFVFYGDTMLHVDLKRMASAHRRDFAATLFVHPNSHPHDSDLIELDCDDRIIGFRPYPHEADRYYGNCVNAALYFFNREYLLEWRHSKSADSCTFDFGKHLFPQMIRGGKKLLGYRSREYIKDAGTPDRLEAVRLDFQTNRIRNGSFRTPIPAVFLDRDGTLNQDSGWLKSPTELTLLPRAAEAVRSINLSGRLAVLITNQPVIARGDCTEATLRQIHNKLEWLLGKSGAFLDRIYYCPHHPDKGFPNERVDLKVSCECRKPAPGLLARAAEELNIDIARSWVIGDSIDDVGAAKAFGLRSILIGSGRHTRLEQTTAIPEYESEDVLQAVNLVLASSLLTHDCH